MMTTFVTEALSRRPWAADGAGARSTLTGGPGASRVPPDRARYALGCPVQIREALPRLRRALRSRWCIGGPLDGPMTRERGACGLTVRRWRKCAPLGPEGRMGSVVGHRFSGSPSLVGTLKADQDTRADLASPSS